MPRCSFSERRENLNESVDNLAIVLTVVRVFVFIVTVCLSFTFLFCCRCLRRCVCVPVYAMVLCTSVCLSQICQND